MRDFGDWLSGVRLRGWFGSVGAVILVMLIWLGYGAATALAVPPSRPELADQLAAAEESRAWFRIHVERELEYEVKGMSREATRESRNILTDGQGRFRMVRPNRHIGQISTTVWDQTECRTLGEGAAGEKRVFPYLTMTEDFPRYLKTDAGLWPILGLMLDFIVTEVTPITRASEILLDTSQAVEISEVIENGRRLTKVFLPDPFQGGVEAPALTLFYDSARDWLLVRSEMESPGPLSARHETRYSHEVRVVEAEEVAGVWMPTLVKDVERYRSEDRVMEVFEATVRLSAIELRPEVDASDFTIAVHSLPEGSSIVDSRLGISYKIGRNLVYMDGRLNEVKDPIRAEISPDKLKRIMKDAVAYIDPGVAGAEAALEPVVVKGRGAKLSTRGFALMGFGLALFGLVVWRRSRV